MLAAVGGGRRGGSPLPAAGPRPSPAASSPFSHPPGYPAIPRVLAVHALTRGAVLARAVAGASGCVGQPEHLQDHPADPGARAWHGLAGGTDSLPEASHLRSFRSPQRRSALCVGSTAEAGRVHARAQDHPLPQPGPPWALYRGRLPRSPGPGVKPDSAQFKAAQQACWCHAPGCLRERRHDAMSMSKPGNHPGWAARRVAQSGPYFWWRRTAGAPR